MTDPDSPLAPIIAQIAIAAPIEHVWEVMTSETTVPDWLGCLNYRRLLGVTFHMQPDPAKRASGVVAGATHCEVTTLDEPRLFSFTWYVPGTPKTIVSILLTATGPAETVVVLTHSGWEQFPAAMVKPFHDQLKSGWSSAVLPGLKRLAERAS